METEQKISLGPQCPVCKRHFRTQEGADECRTNYKRIEGWTCKPSRPGDKW